MSVTSGAITGVTTLNATSTITGGTLIEMVKMSVIMVQLLVNTDANTLTITITGGTYHI